MKNRSFLVLIILFAAVNLSCALAGWNQPVSQPEPGSQPPSPRPPTKPSQPSELTDMVTVVQVYLVALEDGGAAGQPVGCGDSLVPVTLMIEPADGALRASLTHLLALRDQQVGESGLYNALYSSDLTVKEIRLENGEAGVYLTGSLKSGGVCDDPRIIGQLEATALQFSGISEVSFFVNGLPIEDLLSGK